MISYALFFLLVIPLSLVSRIYGEVSDLPLSLYPCSGRHREMKANPLKRELSFHNDIFLSHNRLWCLDCHNASNRDRLNMPGGRTVSFNEIPSLCGICHGSIYSHWSQGVHGKRTGNWDGQKHYLICTDCHNPHSPRFKPIRPEPPPLRPERTLR